MMMSTYLVAFVVGPLEATEPIDVDGIPLRVIHVPGKGHLTEFALEIGAHSLRWYQKYYGIPYPSDKVDMLALPDFAAGAMENLGCITYRENLLLADPKTATQFELQNLADVVAHEVAHMWFGDLVTMRWWNGIWLNEAFATFMEIACCDAFRPDWQRWTTFSLERSMAFETDSLASTRSVEFPVEAPADCDGMFDVLTYQKGGSLLRMLEQYLGAEGFRQGISLYLKTHAYGNTETGDLWDAIEKANPAVPVRTLMDSWIWQPGYPLISARLDGNELVLNQQRFAYTDTDDPTVFVVPIHLSIDGVESKLLLDSAQARVPLPSPDATVVVNAGGHGFMRVAYDDTLRARLDGDTLTSLTVIDRYNLVDDAWNAVISRPAGGGRLPRLRRGVPGRSRPRRVAGDRGRNPRAQSPRRRAGIRGAAEAHRRSRASRRRRPRVGACRGRVGSHLEAPWLDGRRSSPCRATTPMPRRAVGRCWVTSRPTRSWPQRLPWPWRRSAPMLDFEEFVQRFRTAATPQLKYGSCIALAEFPDEDQIQRTIDLALSGEVKTQDAPFLLNRCIANRHNGVDGMGARPPAVARAGRAIPRQHHRADGRFDHDADRAARRGRRAGLLLRAPHPAGGQDARAAARASTRQRRPARHAKPSH